LDEATRKLWRQRAFFVVWIVVGAVIVAEQALPDGSVMVKMEAPLR